MMWTSTWYLTAQEKNVRTNRWATRGPTSLTRALLRKTERRSVPCLITIFHPHSYKTFYPPVSFHPSACKLAWFSYILPRGFIYIFRVSFYFIFFSPCRLQFLIYKISRYSSWLELYYFSTTFSAGPHILNGPRRCGGSYLLRASGWKVGGLGDQTVSPVTIKKQKKVREDCYWSR